MPQNTQEKSRINRVLGIYGLPQLGSAGLNEALAFLIGQDPEPEKFFRSLLMKCEPEERGRMYESLRPHLPFQAKPLDVYLSECGDLAERKQLPTITDDGKLAPFRIPEIRTDTFRVGAVGVHGINEEALQEAIGAQLAKGSLELVCRKCTREGVFHGKNKAEAIQYARMAGWTYDEVTGNGREICPECPVAVN